MSSYDIVIKNGLIVDGTGRPGFRADIGVKGDTIAAIGRVADCTGATVIDAAGKVVSPGFIEIHTHYDPQLCWDRSATPAGEHGVTTVIMGNCSLSLAPVKPGFGPRITKMFNKIEDIDTRFFDAAVPYSWQSFPEYLEFTGSDLGVNVAASVGHSMLRHYVMGDAAQERTATDAEIDEMCGHLRAAIEAGAFGLSMAYDHLTDEHARPLASSYADTRERIALAQTVVEAGRVYVQATINATNLEAKLAEYDELGEIALASGASVSALAVLDAPYQAPGQYKVELAKMADYQAKGARFYVQTMVRPFDVSFRLSKAMSGLYQAPKWSTIMLEPHARRMELLSDRTIWPELHEARLTNTGQDLFAGFRVKEAMAPENQQYIGQSLGDIAAAQGISVTAAMLQISLADDLETLYDATGLMHGDVDVVAEIMDNPLVQLGGSDSGAHVAQFAGAGDPPFVLRHYVRDHRKFTLERAIQRMTGDLARDFAIKRRGTITTGNFADLVIFDPETVDRGPEVALHDLPGGGMRYIRHSVGIEKVLVNGALFFDQGSYTTARAGRVI